MLLAPFAFTHAGDSAPERGKASGDLPGAGGPDRTAHEQPEVLEPEGILADPSDAALDPRDELSFAGRPR